MNFLVMLLIAVAWIFGIYFSFSKNKSLKYGYLSYSFLNLFVILEGILMHDYILIVLFTICFVLQTKQYFAVRNL